MIAPPHGAQSRDRAGFRRAVDRKGSHWGENLVIQTFFKKGSIKVSCFGFGGGFSDLKLVLEAPQPPRNRIFQLELQLGNVLHLCLCFGFAGEGGKSPPLPSQRSPTASNLIKWILGSEYYFSLLCFESSEMVDPEAALRNGVRFWIFKGRLQLQGPLSALGAQGGAQGVKKWKFS